MAFAITGTALGLTFNQWAEQTRRNHLAPLETYNVGRLENALDTANPVVETTYPVSGLRPQAIIEIDGEQMLVFDDVASGTSNTDWTVARGYRDTVAAAHAAGALVHVQPRWPLTMLAELLQQEVRSWSPNIIIPAAATFDVGQSVETIDLDGLENFEVMRVLRIQQQHPRSPNSSWPTRDFRLERLQDENFYPSGYALRIVNAPFRSLGGKNETTRKVRIAIGYRPPTFTEPPNAGTWAMASDIGTVMHLNGTLADAARFGVAGRLLQGAEVERTNTTSSQRDRRAEDVPPGHSLQAGQSLLAERDRLLKQEGERLSTQWSGFFVMHA